MIRSRRRKPKPVELLDPEFWQVPDRLNETNWRVPAERGGRRGVEGWDKEQAR